MTLNNHPDNAANHIPDDDLILFALQLLPEERMNQAMSHLGTCEACRTEVAKIQGDLAAYSMTAEPAPLPSGSRDRFMRQIAREPRVAELPAFQLKPTEYELSQAEKLDVRPAETLTLTPQPGRPAAAAEERINDRAQDWPKERFEDRLIDRAEHRTEHRTDRPEDRADHRMDDHRVDDHRVDDHRIADHRMDDRTDHRSDDRGLTLTGPQSSEPVFSARQSRTLSRGTRRDDREDLEVYREERRPFRRAPWVLAWTGWAVAAGCSFVAGLQLHQRQQIQGAIVTQQARIDDLQKQAGPARQAQEALSTLTATNAMQVALHATPTSKPAVAVKGAPPVVPPEALAAYLADKGALVFVATHMAPTPEGKTYELWLLPANGQNPIPAGTFKPDAQGSASVVLPNLPKGVQAKGFGVTVEDDGGSSTPTLPIVMS